MSATAQMRAMLDELMGTSRDGAAGQVRHKYQFTDVRVCKSFLLACCPHDILASTRMDLGECPKVHDLALRADYEKAARSKDYGYEFDAYDHLSSFVRDSDKKTELAKKRLADTQEELTVEVNTKLGSVNALAEEIGKALAKAEELGAEGRVDESLKYLEEVDKLKREKAVAEAEYRASMPASSYQQQKLRVCEICSAYLGIHDNDRRLADHFGGKLHLGFITIREKLEELKKMVKEKRERPVSNDDDDRRHARRGDSRERDRERRDRDRDRERERDQDRMYDRDRSDRDRRDRRDRDRGLPPGVRSAESRSDRDRDRDRRDRDRDRSDRDRDRERRGGREHNHRRAMTPPLPPPPDAPEPRSNGNSKTDNGSAQATATRERSRSPHSPPPPPPRPQHPTTDESEEGLVSD